MATLSFRVFLPGTLLSLSLFALPSSPADAQTCTVSSTTSNTWGGAARDYVYCSNVQNYANAITACNALTGGQYRLVTIDNLTEDTNVAAFSGSAKWIGYNDRASEGTFIWAGIAASGSYVNSVFTGNSGGKDCTRQNTAVTWTVTGCNNTNVFVCEDTRRCGNGVRSGTETCDDGNTTANDGCSSSCQVEFPYTCNTAFPNVCTATTNCANSRSAGLESSEYVYCGVTTRTWDQARTTCQAFGTGWDLAKITSETENTMVYNLWAADGNRGTSMFHGCRDTNASDGALLTWQWVTDNTSCRGAGAAYQNWGPGEPNNGNPTQGCGSFWTGVPYQWDDLGCAQTVPFICEGPSTCGNGLRAPTTEACDDGNTANGDGCSSTCQIETPPVCGDGVISGGEACDDGNTTNGDGCSSTCTIQPGYTCTGAPSVCTTACTGGTWLSRSTSETTEYFRCTTTVQWGVGRNNCTTLGGSWNLATVNNSGENTWIQSTLLGGANRWIGANDTNVEGTYEWSSGFAWGSYINWAAGEPSNAGATDDCAIMLTASGAWDIQTCSNTFGYVCEGPPLCGNGVRATPEACDDGNLVNGDGCSSTCVVEAGYTCTNSGPSVPSTCTANCVATPTWSSYLGGTALQTTEYYYCTTAVNWTNALTNCGTVASSWSLPKISGGIGGYTAAQENSHISATTTAVMWTGLNDNAVEGSYVWASDGSALGAYTNWQSGQPDNSGTNPPGSDCVAMLNNGSGTWDDLVCTTTNGFICEGPPVCGNGVLASPEQCDDGDLVNADGCSSACTVETGFACTPTNPSVCTVTTLVAVDSVVAYANPSGPGIVIEWLGLYDPSSRGFDVMRQRPAEVFETRVNETELPGTGLGGKNQMYKVVDPDGTLDDVYWVIEKKFDGTAARYSAMRPTANKPAHATSDTADVRDLNVVTQGARGAAGTASSGAASDSSSAEAGCSIRSTFAGDSRGASSAVSLGWLSYFVAAVWWTRRRRGARRAK